jgi:hypothetical protein
MIKIIIPLILSLLICGKAYTQEGFDGIRCGSNIPEVLIGKHLSNERVIVTESHHKNIGLKDLGGSEISDSLFLESWLICGNEYLLIVNTRNDVVRDVLPFPSHSKIFPEFIGECQINGQKDPEEIIAVLDNEAGQKAANTLQGKILFVARVAWKINEKYAKFVKIPTEGLRCPREGIITADGGY